VRRVMEEPLRVGSDGSLHLDLFPSRYAFEVDVDGIHRRTEIDVTAKSPSEFEVRLPIRGPTGVLRGRVFEFGSGRPIAEACVAWSVGGGTRPSEGESSTSTDTDGRFTLERVPAGPIVVVARCLDETHGSTSKCVVIREDGELTLDLPVGRLHPDDPALACISTEITVVDDATGAPIEGSDVSFETELDGARLGLGGRDSDREGRTCDRVAAAARYTVSACGPVSSRPPYKATYETAKVTVESVAGTLRATIRLHRKP
jgi:hypothetical protein